MNKFYKRFIILFLLVLIISGGVIYFTVDINTLKNLTVFKPWSILLAICFVGIGLILDGSRLMHLVRISNEEISLEAAVQVVFGNYFLALLTPGATGGAVAQLMFLRRAGVPAGKATVLVVVRTMVSILFLVFCMPFIFLHDKGILPGVSNSTLIGVSVAAFIVIIAITWAFNTKVLDPLVFFVVRGFGSMKRRKILAFYSDIKGAVRLLCAAPKSMLRVFIESGLSLIALYSVVPCLLLGLGVQADWYTVMGRMIFLNMLLYFSPTPGGSGIAEGGFVLLFTETVPAGTVGIVAVVWRLIAEYLPFLAGFYYTVKVFGRDFLKRKVGA